MRDRVYQSFLERQFEQGMALQKESDVFALFPFGGPVPQRYIASFRCRGLVRNQDGTITEAQQFDAGIYFPPDYLRKWSPTQVVTWLGPSNVFHPNISQTWPMVCLGRMTPGTPLVDLIQQVHQIVTYQKVTMREDDALNPDACAWARRNQARFPVDDRPLKRRAIQFRIESGGSGEAELATETSQSKAKARGRKGQS